MKKKFTRIIGKCLPLLVFICIQVKVWAADTTTVTTIDKNTNIFSQPWIWIGAAVVLAIKLLGPFNDSNEFVVIRKKARKKETV